MNNVPRSQKIYILAPRGLECIRICAQVQLLQTIQAVTKTSTIVTIVSTQHTFGVHRLRRLEIANDKNMGTGLLL